MPTLICGLSLAQLITVLWFASKVRLFCKCLLSAQFIFSLTNIWLVLPFSDQYPKDSQSRPCQDNSLQTVHRRKLYCDYCQQAWFQLSCYPCYPVTMRCESKCTATLIAPNIRKGVILRPMRCKHYGCC